MYKLQNIKVNCKIDNEKKLKNYLKNKNTFGQNQKKVINC